MLVSSSPSSTYAPLVVESKRAGVPLYYAGAVCPKETYPPADPLQFCSTAYGATLDSQAALAFVKSQAKEPVRIGFATMAIPIARAEIEYAEGLAKTLGMTAVDTQITPPPVPDYTPFATRLKDANPNWVYSWSPWVSQVRTFEALRRLGWTGRYITWAHLNAEEELARLKDEHFYVVGHQRLLPGQPADPRRHPRHHRRRPASSTRPPIWPRASSPGSSPSPCSRTPRGRPRPPRWWPP